MRSFKNLQNKSRLRDYQRHQKPFNKMKVSLSSREIWLLGTQNPRVCYFGVLLVDERC